MVRNGHGEKELTLNVKHWTKAPEDWRSLYDDRLLCSTSEESPRGDTRPTSFCRPGIVGILRLCLTLRMRTEVRAPSRWSFEFGGNSMKHHALPFLGFLSYRVDESFPLLGDLGVLCGKWFLNTTSSCSPSYGLTRSLQCLSSDVRRYLLS